MLIAFAIIGVLAAALVLEYVCARALIRFYAPEWGSNAHLREWLRANPGLDLSSYPSL